MTAPEVDEAVLVCYRWWRWLVAAPSVLVVLGPAAAYLYLVYVDDYLGAGVVAVALLGLLAPVVDLEATATLETDKTPADVRSDFTGLCTPTTALTLPAADDVSEPPRDSTAVASVETTFLWVFRGGYDVHAGETDDGDVWIEARRDETVVYATTVSVRDAPGATRVTLTKTYVAPTRPIHLLRVLLQAPLQARVLAIFGYREVASRTRVGLRGPW